MQLNSVSRFWVLLGTHLLDMVLEVVKVLADGCLHGKLF